MSETTETLFASDRQRRTATALAELTWCNPFEPRRVELERRALGDGFTPHDVVWHERGEAERNNPNLERLRETATELATTLRERLANPGVTVSEEEASVYRDLAFYLLFNRYEKSLLALVPLTGTTGSVTFPDWPDLRRELAELLAPLAGRAGAVSRLAREVDPGHLVACFFQLRRAFHHVFVAILGSSAPAARLRSEVWHSIFSHDLGRYWRGLHRAMGDITTLVTGPSGTGKEVVARAVGLGRYLPFDPAKGSFSGALERQFFPLNLSALSPTLVESELFGHKRGAFTGAVADRTGWLETCPATGTVFLDEIGEVSEEIQVKLLRVVEARTFERLGENRPREFSGKLVAATNRDLGAEMHRGRFRQDLYYRLCGDIVRTPSLAERLGDDPAELGHLVSFLARRIVGEREAPALAREVESWVETELGPGYPWPGNVRELDQCVRNVLLRREYRPATAERSPTPGIELAEAVAGGELTLDELTTRYARLVHQRSGSYSEAARHLGVDRRTVKKWVTGG